MLNPFSVHPPQQFTNFTMQTILESLWKSRHGHKHWHDDTLIFLGERLIQAHHLAGNTNRAIHLAEDISYNLQRVLGGLHPLAQKISEILSQLYMSTKQYGDAMGVHENILQLITSGDDGDDRTQDDVKTPREARLHLDLLKLSYQRNGGWVKSEGTYKLLVDNLLSMKQFRGTPDFKNATSVDKWSLKKDEASAEVGYFTAPPCWTFIVGQHAPHGPTEIGKPTALPAIQPRESGWSLRRISSNWGMGSKFFGNGQSTAGELKTHIDY